MSQKRRILSYGLAYLLWVVSTGIGILVLNLMRETILLGLVASSANVDKSEEFYQSYRVAAASHWSILIIGMLVIVLLILFEHIYRTSIETGSLWRRFFHVTGLELVVLFVTHSIYFILQRNFISTGWWAIVIPTVEFLLAALFLAASAYIQKTKEA